MNDEINWDDDIEVAARLVAQFGAALAQMLALYDHEGRYDELVDGFREGRLSLNLKHNGLEVLETADVPPPTSN